MYRKGLFFVFSFLFLVAFSTGGVKAATYSGTVYWVDGFGTHRWGGTGNIHLNKTCDFGTYPGCSGGSWNSNSLWTMDPNPSGAWSITFDNTQTNQLDFTFENGSGWTANSVSSSCGGINYGTWIAFHISQGYPPDSCTINFQLNYIPPTSTPIPPTPTPISPTSTISPSSTPTVPPGTPTPTPVSGSSWWQAGNAGILSVGNISSALPAGKNLVTGNVGVVATKNSILTASGGLSASNWKLQGTNSIADTFLSKFNFDTVRSRVRTYTRAKDASNQVTGNLGNCFWANTGVLTESGAQGSCPVLGTSTSYRIPSASWRIGTYLLNFIKGFLKI